MATFGIPNVERLAGRGDVRALLQALEYQNPTVNGDRQFANKGASVRAKAVVALARLGQPEADAGLVRALGDSDEGVRAAAIAALHERGGEAPAEELSVAVATWTSEEQSAARRAALDALLAIGDADAPVKLADKLMSRPGASVPADREVLRKLAEATTGGQGMQRAISHLLSVLGDPARDSRAMTMLVWLAPESVQPLIDALGEPLKRQQAALALGYTRDAKAAAPLRRLMLGSPDPAMARAAAWALGRIGEPESGRELLAAAGHHVGEAETDSGFREAPWLAPETLRGLDIDGLAEYYDIAVEAWRTAERNGNADQSERWRLVAAAIVDEARGRPESGSTEQPPKQSGFRNRRRDRQRAVLLQACRQHAGNPAD